jgi:hypothetical protein
MKFTPRQLLLAAALVAIVAAFVLASRFGGDTAGVPTTTDTGYVTGQDVPFTSGSAAAQQGSPSSPTSAAPATDGHDHADDDGEAEEPPLLVQPTAAPDVAEAATQFAAAWLNIYNRDAPQWRAELADKTTADMALALADADPASVPADTKAGKATATVQGDLRGATVPVLTGDGKKQLGTLTLTFVNDRGRWLVSEIDWQER